MEKDWREIFALELADEKVTFQTEAGECGANCQEAKEIKCVCRCGGKNHGAALKQNIKSLDNYTEKETVDDPVVFDPEDYMTELAVLA